MAQTRVNGYAQPGSFYGLTPRIFSVAVANVHVGNTTVDGTYDLCVRGINSVASIITVTPPASSAFLVQVDRTFGGSANDLANAVNASANVTSTVAELRFSGNALVSA